VTIDDEMENKIEAIPSSKREQNRLQICYAISGGEWKCVGISAADMADNETPGQLKQEIVKLLKDAGIDVKVKDVHWIMDGGYDG